MPKELPSDLQALARWLIWKSEERDGKPTKVPYNVRTGQRAAVDDPSSWVTFDEAQEAAEKFRAGLGFVLGNGVAGIDLDHCRNAETGAIEPWAQRIINTVDTYTEVSPSGTGVHLIFFGTLPAGRRRFGRVEMYDDKRFFTITGEVLGNRVKPEARAAVVRETWTDLNSVHEFLVWAKSNKQSKVLEYWKGFGDENRSDGDNALVHALITFTKHDSVRVDRLFRLSGRMRPKWDEVHHADGSTYGQGTIKAALEKAAASATSTDAPLALVPRWWADLKKAPPVEPTMLVERLMLAADINMIAGASYAGKSTVALDLAVSIATGVDALGKFKVPKAGRVLYVYAEHHEGAWWSNLQRVAEYRGFADATDLPIGLLAGYKMSLAKPADLAALVALIQKHDIKTIILDPLSTLTTVEGDSENDASAVIRSARKPLQILVQDTGVSIIVIHHSTKMYLRVEPYSANELVRGSGDLLAMTGAILGVWAYTDPKERGMVKILPTVRGPQAGIFRCGPRGAAPVERSFGEGAADPAASFEPLGFFDWHSNVDRTTPEQQTLQVLMEQPGGVASPDTLTTATSKSRATIMRHLGLLVSQGLVEHTGTGAYRVKTEAAPGAETDESLL